MSVCPGNRVYVRGAPGSLVASHDRRRLRRLSSSLERPGQTVQAPSVLGILGEIRPEHGFGRGEAIPLEMDSAENLAARDRPGRRLIVYQTVLKGDGPLEERDGAPVVPGCVK